MNPYEELANAIIIQAVRDYKSETRKLRRLMQNEPPPDPPKPEEEEQKGKKQIRGPHEKWEGKVILCRSELASIERFFYSRWFEVLSEADGPAIFREVKKEVEGI